MDNSTPKDATAAFEKALQEAEQKKYLLRLFVSGMTPRSLRAIENLKKICQEHLAGRYELEVIDLYQHPEAGKQEQLVAAPTLIRKLPLPLRKFIGDLSDSERILVGLDLVPRSDDQPEPGPPSGEEAGK